MSKIKKKPSLHILSTQLISTDATITAWFARTSGLGMEAVFDVIFASSFLFIGRWAGITPGFFVAAPLHI